MFLNSMFYLVYQIKLIILIDDDIDYRCYRKKSETRSQLYFKHVLKFEKDSS